MKLINIIFIMILTAGITSAYPVNETGAIIAEKYPDANRNYDIVSRNSSGEAVNFSKFPYISFDEMDYLWHSIETKRLADSQNQTKKALSQQDLQVNYQNQIDNLNTVINNSNFIQTKTNWTNAEVVQYIKVLAWNDEILVKGQIIILKILRWMLW